jgi:hypothetical protein
MKHAQEATLSKEEFSEQVENENLLKTIKLPRNLGQITDRLP